MRAMRQLREGVKKKHRKSPRIVFVAVVVSQKSENLPKIWKFSCGCSRSSPSWWWRRRSTKVKTVHNWSRTFPSASLHSSRWWCHWRRRGRWGRCWRSGGRRWRRQEWGFWLSWWGWSKGKVAASARSAAASSKATLPDLQRLSLKLRWRRTRLHKAWSHDVLDPAKSTSKCKHSSEAVLRPP